MSQFNYQDYQNIVNRAQFAPNTNAVRVGFFKLKDGEDALVRINVSKLDDLKFATVHKPVFGKKFEGLGTGYTPVSCLNEVGSYSDACPFCKAAAEGHRARGRARSGSTGKPASPQKEKGWPGAALRGRAGHLRPGIPGGRGAGGHRRRELPHHRLYR